MRRVAFILALLCAPVALAQTPPAQQRPLPQPTTAAAPCMAGLKMVNGQLMQSDCNGNLTSAAVPDDSGQQLSPALSKLTEQEKEAQVEYWTYAYHNTRHVFEWNYISTILIFFIVVLLVLSGLGFAAWQLRYSMQLGSKRMQIMEAHAAALTAAAAGSNTASAAIASEDTNDTTLKISATGLEVHSATLGVIILAFSMCFFYMYLKFVYPIQAIATGTPQTQSQPAHPEPRH